MMDLNKAADLLLSGKIGVLPTDTLYGVVCRASDQTAVGRLYKLKSRQGKPGTLIASSIDQLVDMGLKRRYLKAVEDFWPGPISIIIPCGAELRYLHLGKEGLAIRISSEAKLNALINKVGPLLTSSANHPGEPPANTIEEAEKYFGTNVDFYIDGGDLSGRKPSTVIQIVDDVVDVLRDGAIKIDENGIV